MIIDRSAQKAALMKKFTDPSKPPFPGAVRMDCSECGSLIAWTNPPLPPNGKTMCRECSPRMASCP